jgi:hypothetical protein
MFTKYTYTVEGLYDQLGWDNSPQLRVALRNEEGNRIQMYLDLRTSPINTGLLVGKTVKIAVED